MPRSKHGFPISRPSCTDCALQKTRTLPADATRDLRDTSHHTTAPSCCLPIHIPPHIALSERGFVLLGLPRLPASNKATAGILADTTVQTVSDNTEHPITSVAGGIFRATDTSGRGEDGCLELFVIFIAALPSLVSIIFVFFALGFRFWTLSYATLLRHYDSWRPSRPPVMAAFLRLFTASHATFVLVCTFILRGTRNTHTHPPLNDFISIAKYCTLFAFYRRSLTLRIYNHTPRKCECGFGVGSEVEADNRASNCEKVQCACGRGFLWQRKLPAPASWRYDLQNLTSNSSFEYPCRATIPAALFSGTASKVSHLVTLLLGGDAAWTAPGSSEPRKEAIL